MLSCVSNRLVRLPAAADAVSACLPAADVLMPTPDRSPRIAMLEDLAANETNHDASVTDNGTSTEVALGHTRLISDQKSESADTTLNIEKAKTPSSAHLVPPRDTRDTSNFYDLGNSGLDELERKLSEQVGTRKLKLTDKALPPITVLPIDQQLAIPNVDSAISSLFLPEAVADKVHLAAQQDYFIQGNSKMAAESLEVDEDPLPRLGRRLEARQLRKAATGRVAAWLDGLNSNEPVDRKNALHDDVKENKIAELGSISQLNNGKMGIKYGFERRHFKKRVQSK